MDREDTEVVQELATSLAPVSVYQHYRKDQGGRKLTNVPRVQERKDGANGHDVVELVERHLCDD